MPDATDARRMRLLEILQGQPEGLSLEECADALQVDPRSVRRDVAYLQDLLAGISGVALRNGRVAPLTQGRPAGYFTRHLGANADAKHAIAAYAARLLGSDPAVAVTAGSTAYHTAREIRRRYIEEGEPAGLIVFTNSLPVLEDMTAAGISVGVLGEIYNADDCAFHSHEMRSEFQATAAIIGASGVAMDTVGGGLQLFCHRAEEAAFLKQLLAPAPEWIIVADSSKVGRRHPWCFAGKPAMAGKTVHLVSHGLNAEQREQLQAAVAGAAAWGCRLVWTDTADLRVA
jgi:DeoR/GlpR family transcriptional regulator of sugar metabolism